MRKAVMIVTTLFLASCGDTEIKLSSGPKIFITASKHVGDFKNDPLLSGSSAISKADSFCNKDANKPNNSTYKALMVDGITRDAVNNVDWVLKPNTIYYQPFANIEIGKTTSNSIFPVLYTDLTNSVADIFLEIQSSYTWTGVSNASTYSSGSYDCGDWSVGDNGASGLVGTGRERNSYFISSWGGGCSYSLSLYCVEQL